MKNSISGKQEVIKNLISKGFNFEKDPFQLSSEERNIFSDLAKEFRYRKPKNGYFALGSSFYLHLQKIYGKMK